VDLQNKLLKIKRKIRANEEEIEQISDIQTIFLIKKANRKLEKELKRIEQDLDGEYEKRAKHEANKARITDKEIGPLFDISLDDDKPIQHIAANAVENISVSPVAQAAQVGARPRPIFSEDKSNFVVTFFANLVKRLGRTKPPETAPMSPMSKPTAKTMSH
jgi:hypothetical protein